MDLEHLQMHIVDHCNLKCDFCGHFSNIASQNYLDINWFEEQIIQVSKLFESIRGFLILGGEPLLHPEMLDFLAVSRKHFPNSNIELWTNGIPLEKQKKDFWKSLNKFNIELRVVSYPNTRLDKTRVSELAEIFNVRLLIEDVKFWCRLFNPKGDSNPKKAFINCPSKVCTTLYDGKLYLCPRPAYIHIVNQKQGTQIKVEESDCIDIFANDAKEKIEEFFGKRRYAFSEKETFWLARAGHFLWRHGFKGKRILRSRGYSWLRQVGQFLASHGLLGKRNTPQPLEFCRWCPEKRVPIKWTSGSNKI